MRTVSEPLYISTGVHLATKPKAPLIDHYAIVDLDNSFGLSALARPVVIEHSNRGWVWRDLEPGEEWKSIAEVQDLNAAYRRLHSAYGKSTYRLATNNCEHFARFVVTGERESKQTQRAMILATAATVISLIRSSDSDGK